MVASSSRRWFTFSRALINSLRKVRFGVVGEKALEEGPVFINVELVGGGNWPGEGGGNHFGDLPGDQGVFLVPQLKVLGALGQVVPLVNVQPEDHEEQQAPVEAVGDGQELGDRLRHLIKFLTENFPELLEPSEGRLGQLFQEIGFVGRQGGGKGLDDHDRGQVDLHEQVEAADGAGVEFENADRVEEAGEDEVLELGEFVGAEGGVDDFVRGSLDELVLDGEIVDGLADVGGLELDRPEVGESQGQAEVDQVDAENGLGGDGNVEDFAVVFQEALVAGDDDDVFFDAQFQLVTPRCPWTGKAPRPPAPARNQPAAPPGKC